MFGLFTGKKAKLEQKYAKLLEESHRLSHINRKDSDFKRAEAEAVLEEIKALENNEPT